MYPPNVIPEHVLPDEIVNPFVLSPRVPSSQKFPTALDGSVNERMWKFVSVTPGLAAMYRNAAPP